MARGEEIRCTTAYADCVSVTLQWRVEQVCPIVRPRIYSCRIECCPLVSHVDYAPRAVLRLEK